MAGEGAGCTTTLAVVVAVPAAGRCPWRPPRPRRAGWRSPVPTGRAGTSSRSAHILGKLASMAVLPDCGVAGSSCLWRAHALAIGPKLKFFSLLRVLPVPASDAARVSPPLLVAAYPQHALCGSAPHRLATVPFLSPTSSPRRPRPDKASQLQFLPGCSRPPALLLLLIVP